MPEREDSEFREVDPEDGFFVPMSIDRIRKIYKIRVQNTLLRNNSYQRLT